MLVDTASGKVVLTGRLVSNGQVDSWGGRVFWTADFSSWRVAGHYAIHISSAGGDVSSCQFDIDNDLLERNTLSNVVYYFKGQRASGLMDRADRHLFLPAGQPGFVDVHGGWYDATGDSILNGITAAADDEFGIAFNEGYAVTGKDEDWRWTEQSLPHAAWYLYAISLPHS